MPALFPIFAIVIVLLFISIHSTATAPPRRNRRRTDKGYGKSGSYGGGQKSGGGYSSSGSRSGGGSRGGYDKQRY